MSDKFENIDFTHMKEQISQNELNKLFECYFDDVNELDVVLNFELICSFQF